MDYGAEPLVGRSLRPASIDHRATVARVLRVSTGTSPFTDAAGVHRAAFSRGACRCCPTSGSWGLRPGGTGTGAGSPTATSAGAWGWGQRQAAVVVGNCLNPASKVIDVISGCHVEVFE